MSFQRAVVNCRLCYSFAMEIYQSHEHYIRITDNSPKLDIRIIEKDQRVSNLRERAMQSLEQEDAVSDCISFEERREALNRCMNCNYRQPGIAEIFCSSEKKTE